MTTPIAPNPKAKDSVFTDLFTIPKYLLELYQTLHPEDKTTTEADLKVVTAKCVLAEHIYNDLGFMVGGNQLIMMVEAQSSWSPNIVIRLLIYVAQALNNFFTERKVLLYKDSKVHCPKPELYVVFTGERKSQPEILSFKDLFFAEADDCDIDVRVHVIYEQNTNDIINQYIVFCKMLTEQLKKYGPTRMAIEETLRICRDKKVLVEYLRQRETEIMDIMTTLFDQDYITELVGIERERRGRKKGRKEGRKKGRKEGIKNDTDIFMTLYSQGREDDVRRSIEDPKYLKKMMNEFGFKDDGD
jgi:hypothetical protein